MNYDCLKYDICIVGAGPAGITAALELAKRKISVILIEAGDFGFGDSDLYEATEEGFPSMLRVNRIRAFGGTSGHWAGWCSTFDEEDFQKGIDDYVGWPIQYEEMRSFYKEASQYIDIDHPYSHGADYINLNDSIRLKKFCFSSPVTRFGVKYRQGIERSPYIRLLTESTLVGISSDKAGKLVSSFEVRSKDKQLRVEASHYILACGGIENARLLLNFKMSLPGVNSNFIGRGFMDHPHFYNVGRLVSYNFAGYSGGALTDRHSLDHKIQYFFQLSPKLRRERGLLNSVCRLHETDPSDDFEKDLLRTFIRQNSRNNVSIKSIVLMAEQKYSPDTSRLELISEVDRFNLRKVKLRWNFTEIDWLSYVESLKIFSREISALGLGFFKIDPKLGDRSLTPTPGPHHMGTTKMGDSSYTGVVDKNLTVFGVPNLSVAGSSVFPTSGCTNPTFTIVALSIRLAKYLSERHTP